MIAFTLDDEPVQVPDDGESLLYALREHLGKRCVKDGCSPQGQCGCCTVWIDGLPRVSCVTPARRADGRAVTTTDGLSDDDRERWARAFVGAGASQCGFCTPGIVMRLAALEGRREKRSGANGPDGRPGAATGAAGVTAERVRTALLAHLCRCTGWQTIVEAAADVLGIDQEASSLVADPPRDPLMVQWRAQVEGPAFQLTRPETVLGTAIFADDMAPADARVAVLGADGELVVAGTLAEARQHAHKVQGRNSGVPLVHPVPLPDGEWDLTLQTTWVEPAYLEPDASWCRPGSLPASPLANGGAFGGKRRSPVPGEARRLAGELHAPVRVLWTREDVTRLGPKRPPIAAGVRRDGKGVLRFARTGIGDASALRDDELVLTRRVAAVSEHVDVEHADVLGPPVSAELRGVGWVEASVLLAGLRALVEGRTGPGWPAEVTAPSGGRARVTVHRDDAITVEVWAGTVLDDVTLRSYCIGAVHQALGWVWQEGIAVDHDGQVCDLTIRSFGIVNARDMPHIDVVIHPAATWPVNGSDAVFAATAAAVWVADGLVPHWPTRSGRTST